MKTLLTTLAVLLIATVSYAQTYTVERVIDGDTIKLTNGEEVQLIGVQAPEDEKMGQEATEFVKGLLKEGQEVRLEFDVQERDKYGRLLAYVYTYICDSCSTLNVAQQKHFDNKIYSMLNAQIVSQGYASPMTIPPNVKHAGLFKELHEKARKYKWGLWKETKDSPKLTEAEVKLKAKVYALAMGNDLTELDEPSISYDEKTGEWFVLYRHAKKSPDTGEIEYIIGGHFGIYIDDSSGKILRMTPGA